MRTRTLPAALVVALVAGLGGAAQAQADHHFGSLLKLRCKSDAANAYTVDPLIRAHVVWVMGTSASITNNLRTLKISARLIRNGTNALPVLGWESNQRTDVLADGYNRKQVGVYTDNKSRTQDWNVQVKLRWHRRAKTDWTYNKTYSFDETKCPNPDEGTWLP